MIVGKDFVILSMPKTGCQFRAWVADQYNYKRLCPAWLRGSGLISRHIYHSVRNGCRLDSKYQRKHCCRHYVWTTVILEYLNRHPELPRRFRGHSGLKEVNVWEFRGKEVLSVLRNPYSQALSTYQYKRPFLKKEKRKSYNFAKYIKSQFERQHIGRMQKHFSIEHINYPLGILSYNFIRIHFKDPVKIFTMSAEEFDEYCVSDDYKEDMHPIKFFRTEAMNRQLYEYLKSKPYLDSQIIDEIFEEAKPKNVSKKRADAVWDEETKACFEKAEKFYIRMVKELAPLPEDDF